MQDGQEELQVLHILILYSFTLTELCACVSQINVVGREGRRGGRKRRREGDFGKGNICLSFNRSKDGRM